MNNEPKKRAKKTKSMISLNTLEQELRKQKISVSKNTLKKVINDPIFWDKLKNLFIENLKK